MKNKLNVYGVLSVFFLISCSQKLYSYEVWLGCAKTPLKAIESPELWSITQKGITGFNTNISGFKATDRKNPVVGNEPSMDGYNRKVDQENWNAFFDLLPSNLRGMNPLARSTFYSPEGSSRDDTLENRLDLGFRKARDNGFRIGSLQPYASRHGEDPSNPTLTFSEAELKEIREYLDKESPKVKLPIYSNIRLFRKQLFIEDLATRGKYIDGYVLEAAPFKWYTNQGNRRDMLDYFLSDPNLQKQDLIFQIPLQTHMGFEGDTNYEDIRKFIVWLGDRYGREFLKSSRIKFLIITYYPPIPFYPELDDAGENYQNTLTGITASLIEQEPLFSGRLKNTDGSERVPTNEDAVNTQRLDIKSLSNKAISSKKSALNIYPNPSTDGVFYISKSTDWDLYDSLGRLLEKGSSNKIPVQNRKNGLYYVVADARSTKVIVSN